MKKLLSGLIAILLISSVLLISCGDGVTTTTETSITTTVTDATTTAPPTYSITYELNGGTNSSENPATYKTGDIISLGYPEKADYMFMGWFTDSSLTNEIKEIKDKEENITLYAKWAPTEDIIEFVLSNGEYAVCDLVMDVERVIIPSMYKGLPVTGISNFALSFSDSLKTVVIPDSIKWIGTHSFYKCTSLKSITLPSSLESIGNVTFCECYSLESITVDDGNQTFKSIDGVLYSKDGKTLICYPANKQGTCYTIPDGVTIIGRTSFAFCINLNTVIIPYGVTTVDGAAFANSRLERVAIPDSVVSIKADAFSGCELLKEVVLPSNIEIIETYAFYECSALESIVIPNGVKSIGFRAFYNCESLESIIIPGSVESIGRESFHGCTSLKTVVIEEGVTCLEMFAFSNCPSLESVKLPDTLEHLDYQVFRACVSLKSIVIPNSVITVGSEVVWGIPEITVYCEAESKPDGWYENWCNGAKEVVWGYKEG